MSAFELLEKAISVNGCLNLSLSLLVVPVALITLVVVGFRSYSQKRLMEMLPLLFS
jgi:hypothetical protein